MTLDRLISDYGYLAVFVGTFLEGESLLILGAFTAHQGLLNFPLVILAGFVGALTGDLSRYVLGRILGRKWVDRRPRIRKAVARATPYIEKYPTAFVVGFRFVYGVRVIAPVAIALSGIPTGRFVILNTLAAAIWAVLIGVLGYLFGDVIEAMFGDLQAIEEKVIAGASAVIIVLGISHLVRRRFRRSAKAETTD